jgi:hypothetical protein
MRTLGRAVFLLLLVAVVFTTGRWAWDGLSSVDPLQRYAGTPELLRSTAYQVPDDRWLEFPLPNRNGLRVLSTALVAAEQATVVDQRWGYTLAFQLLGGGDEPLREWTYHYRTGVTRYTDTATGRFQPRSYVAGLQAMPADSRVTMLPALELQGATRLRVKVLARQPGLQEILLRCYAHERVAEHKLGFLWKRLDPVKRERIARASVLGAEFLRDTEKQNLLRWQWSPIGPAGVDQQDFQSRTLFVFKDNQGESVDEQVLPEGVYADQYTRGVLSLPDGVWDLQLEVIDVDDQTASGARAPVQVRWFAREGAGRWQVDLAADRATPYRRAGVAGGLLEVHAEQPVIVRVYLFGSGQWLSLRPEPRRLRTYRIESGAALEYRVEHVQDAPTPLRIDLRALWNRSQALPRNVHYQLLDSAGRELGSGDIAVQQALSLYEQVALPVAAERVSEVERRYFYLPAKVVALRLSATIPVLVSAYSRPDDLVRRVRVPEDYQDVPDDPARHPAWFLVRPPDHQALRLQRRAVELVLQTRPPEVDAQIEAGHYAWEEYQPHGTWRARQLLVPRSAEHEVRARSRAVVFAPLPANRPTQLSLLGQVGREQVSPTLIYVGSGTAPNAVSVELDGTTVATTRLFSPRARLQLPPVAVGEHRLHIHSALAGEWWINYSDAGAGAHLLRQALSLNDLPLRFDYHKRSHNEEVLSGALYCSGDARAELRVSIDNRNLPDLSPRRDWTFLQRSFDIYTDPARAIPVLDSPDRQVGQGQVFFLPLGEDLPPGHYTVTLRKQSPAACYLNLHRIIAGPAALRRLYREGDLAAEGEDS